MSEERIVGATEAGMRADVFVSLYFDVTRTAAARLLEEGAALVNGKTAAKNLKLKESEGFV